MTFLELGADWMCTVVRETKAKYTESKNVQFSISTNIPAGMIIKTTKPGMR